MTKEIMRKIIVLVVLAIMIFPFFWIISSSFKSFKEIMTMDPSVFPKDPTTAHYHSLFSIRNPSKDFPANIMNSIIVGISTGIISIFISVLGAYSLARFPFKGSATFSKMLLVVYVLPGIPLLLPIYDLLARIRLVDTLPGLILVYTAINSPFAVWLLRSFFEAVPIELEEAARVDGASGLRAFYSITLPLCASGIVTAFMFVFVSTWGEYTLAQLIITEGAKKTVPLGLATYMTDQYIEWGPLLAATTLIVVPVLIFFLPLSKYFISGLSAGALKE
ncbi:MAG: carbohydrate ABC transporter permease [Thermotogota bacterium]|nr:carbohydrate ABC transporter permease [Thermotogota bacterium]